LRWKMVSDLRFEKAAEQWALVLLLRSTSKT
jgi:hypothetical protein